MYKRQATQAVERHDGSSSRDPRINTAPDPDLLLPGRQHYWKLARWAVHEYNKELLDIMRNYGAFVEGEVMVGRVKRFHYGSQVWPHFTTTLPVHAWMQSSAGRAEEVGAPGATGPRDCSLPIH